MDYVVKVVDAPSIIDGVMKHGRQTVNNLKFGRSDKFDGVVSEPANAEEISIFRLMPGFVILDSHTGSIVSEPPRIPIQIPNEEKQETETQAQVPPPTDPDEEWFKGFKERFLKNESSRKRLGKDELRRAVTLLKVNVDPEADKAALTSTILEVLEATSEVTTE